MAENKKLTDLLVDEEEINEELLAGTVGEYVKIGNESGSLHPEKEYEQLDSKEKIIVTLLAQKARFELDMVEEERLGPKAISKLSGVKGGTVKPGVRGLQDEGIARNEDGKYWIPTVRLERARDYLGDD